MTIFGIDVSHHQGASLDFAAFRRAGVEFAFIKATEGADFQDSQFAKNLAKAQAAGMLVAAYHYVRSNATAAAQVANVVRTMDKAIPVIPDVEANSGGTALVRDIVAKLQAAGYHVPLTYLPRWYWQQIGSPSLSGLPSLWSSRYPDNTTGSLADEYADVPGSYWNGYGGLGVTVLQFSSAVRLPGYGGNLDANAYKGTREQLAAVLGGQKENEMEATDLVVDPATGKPALDVNGNPFSYNAAIFYTNKAVWETHDRVEALAASIGDQVKAAVEAYLAANPPAVQVDYAAIAKAVNDDAARRGAE